MKMTFIFLLDAGWGEYVLIDGVVKDLDRNIYTTTVDVQQFSDRLHHQWLLDYHYLQRGTRVLKRIGDPNETLNEFLNIIKYDHSETDIRALVAQYAKIFKMDISKNSDAITELI